MQPEETANIAAAKRTPSGISRERSPRSRIPLCAD